MPTKRCCCNPVSCRIHEDDFERSDSNPPSGFWQVVSGEWEIKVDPNVPTNQILSSISDGPIIITKRQPAPTNPGGRYATVTFLDLIDIPSGDTKEWGIICGYKDANNFDWIHLTLSSSDGRIEPVFYRRTGGTDSVVADVTTNPQNNLGAGFEPFFDQGTPLDKVSISICYSTLEWSLIFSDPALELVWTVCDGGLDSLPAYPYGTFGFLFGQFDNVIHEQHFESREDCDKCGCLCSYSRLDKACWPDTLRLVALAGPGFSYGDPCPEDELGTWDIDVLLYRCSNPDAVYADYPGTPPVFPRDTDRFLWYSDPFESQGTYYWFVVHCGTNNGKQALYVAIMVYGDEDPYDQSTTPPFGGNLSFTRVNPGPNPSPPGYSIPNIGAFSCNPIYLNFLAGLGEGDVLDNNIATSGECEGPQWWHTLIITEP